MTPAQLRAARAYLQIKVEDLANEAQVAPNTISRFEREEGSMRRATAEVIRRVLESKGVVPTMDGGIGILGSRSAEMHAA